MKCLEKSRFFAWKISISIPPMHEKKCGGRCMNGMAEYFYFAPCRKILRRIRRDRGGGGNRAEVLRKPLFFQPCEISKKIFAEMPNGISLALRKRRIGRSRRFSFPVRDIKTRGKPHSKNSPQYEACAHLGLGKRRLPAFRKTAAPARTAGFAPMRAGGFSAAP